MPVLNNAKHEIFAQAVANGADLSDAYEEARLKKGHRGNPSRLRHRIEVERRITEILSERANKVVEKYAAEVEYTREKLLAELEDARQIAREAKNGSAAAMATLGKAKILGLIVDRREVGDVGAFDGHTDEQLIEEARARAKALGITPGPLADLPDSETEH